MPQLSSAQATCTDRYRLSSLGFFRALFRRVESTCYEHDEHHFGHQEIGAVGEEDGQCEQAEEEVETVAVMQCCEQVVRPSLRHEQEGYRRHCE